MRLGRRGGGTGICWSPFWLSDWRAALVESSRPSPSNSQFFHAGSQGECRRPVVLTGLSAHPLRPSHPLRPPPPKGTAVFTAHFPPHNKNGWTAGHSDTVSHSHTHRSSPGRVTFGHSTPRRLAGCSWVLGPSQLSLSAGKPCRGDGFRTADHESRQIAPFPRRPSHLTLTAHLLPCHLPDSEAVAS